ncbi:MAG: lytic transglycosylase domain-containing protein [Proteobacteria bacterium]|nr:lytic transglycosylase domain-containing protein [Pseudomonadota bacterium]
MKRVIFPDLRIALCLSATALTAGCAALAQAQVIEIDAAGNVFSRTGTGAVEWVATGAPSGEDYGDQEPVEADLPAIPAAALTELQGPPSPTGFADMLAGAADRAGISPVLLEALVWQESRWNPRAVSPVGAIGLGQLMPGTARHLGVDPWDPQANLIGAALYLRQQLDRFGGNVELALAAYNAGPGRVEKAGGIPRITETRNYVAVITGRLSARARAE